MAKKPIPAAKTFCFAAERAQTAAFITYNITCYKEGGTDAAQIVNYILYVLIYIIYIKHTILNFIFPTPPSLLFITCYVICYKLTDSFVSFSCFYPFKLIKTALDKRNLSFQFNGVKRPLL